MSACKGKITNTQAHVKYKLGICMVVLSLTLPIIGILLTFVPMPSTLKIFVSLVCIIGLPDILFCLGAVLAGKEVVTKIKAKVFHYYNKPVGKARYYFGCTLFASSILANFALQSLFMIFDIIITQGPLLYYATITLNIMMILGFILSGHLFWDRLKRAFYYDREKMQPCIK